MGIVFVLGMGVSAWLNLPGDSPAQTAEMPRPSFGASPSSLVEADRALQKSTADIGLRQSIVGRAIGYAILLAPRPVGALGWLKEHDLPFDPRTWRLSLVEVSGSGTIGYTVSEWTAAPDSNGLVPHGEQLFIWRFHPVVGWKLLLHAAVRTPQSEAGADSLVLRKLSILYGDQPGTHEAAHTEAAALVDADRALGDSVESRGWATAITDRMTPDALWIRDGQPMRRGKVASAVGLAATPDDCRCETIGSHAADSADLGYTYGRCAADSARVRFSYVRVWRKDETDARHIELQLEIPIPSDSED
jgi:hypothetical protein